MDYRIKRLFSLLLGVFLICASVVEVYTPFKMLFLTVGVLNISIQSCMICLYNYSQGYYEGLK